MSIGKIEVVRYETSFSHYFLMRSPTNKSVNFTQANKKDVAAVTRKEYCMATTRRGKLIRQEKPYSRSKLSPRSIWTIGDEIDKLHVEYHMTQTLLDWGIKPIRPGWPLKESTETIVIE